MSPLIKSGWHTANNLRLLPPFLTLRLDRSSAALFARQSSQNIHAYVPRPRELIHRGY